MEIENEKICIDYLIEEEKGNKLFPSYENIVVKHVEVWCEAIDDWLDVTELESEELDKEVMRLIEENRPSLED